MENKKPTNKVESKNEITNVESTSGSKLEGTTIPKKPVKPPKVEDKPFEEFIIKHFIPGLKTSIEQRGFRGNSFYFLEDKTNKLREKI